MKKSTYILAAVVKWYSRTRENEKQSLLLQIWNFQRLGGQNGMIMEFLAVGECCEERSGVGNLVSRAFRLFLL